MAVLRAAAFSLTLLAPSLASAGEHVPLERNPSAQARLHAQWLKYNPPSNVRSCSLREETGQDGRKVVACR